MAVFIFSILEKKLHGGGYSSVSATLELMRTALDVGQFDYYQILQGLDYPIASNLEISYFLSSHKGTEFINAASEEDLTRSRDKYRYCLRWYFDKDGNPFHAATHLFSKVFVRLAANFNFQPRVPRVNDGERRLIIYRGWAHFCITYEAVRYILNYCETHPKFCDFFHHVYAPDESFFHTILYNNDELMKKTVRGRALRKEERNHFTLLNLTYFEYPHLVRVFKTVSEWPTLRDSGYLYFRKATSSESAELLDYIDSLHESERL